MALWSSVGLVGPVVELGSGSGGAQPAEGQDLSLEGVIVLSVIIRQGLVGIAPISSGPAFVGCNPLKCTLKCFDEAAHY